MFFFESFHSEASLRPFTTGPRTNALQTGVLLVPALAAALIAAPATTPAAATESCRTVTDLTTDAGRWIRADEPASQETYRDCFEWVVPERGWAMISAHGAQGLRLDLDGGDRFDVLHQTTDGVFFAASPGTYRIRVSSQDSNRDLPAYGVRTAFVTTAHAQLNGALATLPDEDDDEGIEIVIDPFAESCPKASADPFSEDEDEGIEIVIDPFAEPCGPAPADAQIAGLQGMILDDLCRRLADDDHGDTVLCASTLSSAEMVAAGSGTVDGFDRDLFFFELDRRQTVDMAVDGDLELTLYDRHGQEMGRAEGRLARTLVPGGYWVGVRSTSTGDEPYGYEITLERR